MSNKTLIEALDVLLESTSVLVPAEYIIAEIYQKFSIEFTIRIIFDHFAHPFVDTLNGRRI
jgi:hypothetical protein